MHVYLRDEPVDLEMREVEPEGLLSDDSALIPVAFFADGNESPSFRAFLPPETIVILHQVIRGPVRLGLMAEEPEEPDKEIQAMVGLTIPVEALPPGMVAEAEEEGEHEREPWQTGGGTEPWKSEDAEDDEDRPRTVMLAFAPLVRIKRRHPEDFSEELADLLESALSGATKPSLEARVERMLGL
ncbi:MAG TPA: hypothetical protein VFY65_06145 [Longimicrobium sp.]|nr:hypothetical protein [Longimicrobium sp.]